MARESDYQHKLIGKLKHMFPGCFITKQDAVRTQGIPDLLILFEDKWAMLEVKRSEREARQANQEFYVEKFNRLSFASFIYPENEEQVLHDLQSAFGVVREARVS